MMIKQYVTPVQMAISFLLKQEVLIVTAPFWLGMFAHFFKDTKNVTLSRLVYNYCFKITYDNKNHMISYMSLVYRFISIWALVYYTRYLSVSLPGNIQLGLCEVQVRAGKLFGYFGLFNNYCLNSFVLEAICTNIFLLHINFKSIIISKNDFIKICQMHNFNILSTYFYAGVHFIKIIITLQ